VAKLTTKQQAERRLARIDSDLNAVAGFMEERGLDSQADLLDEAGQNVENVLDTLASL
jgi:hypothetical protein